MQVAKDVPWRNEISFEKNVNEGKVVEVILKNRVFAMKYYIVDTRFCYLMWDSAMAENGILKCGYRRGRCKCAEKLHQRVWTAYKNKPA